MDDTELKDLLEQLHDKYNNLDFIAGDPIGIPHRYSRSPDREISGFLASVIAWGNRKAIVKSAARMMQFMDDDPYAFVSGASDAEIERCGSFVHRTFNGGDFTAFIIALRNLCSRYGSLGGYFRDRWEKTGDMRSVLSDFRSDFFSGQHPVRCEKHLSSVDRGSACKRLNMFLRWMVRRDDRGVDFGIWDFIPASALLLPLDVHAGNMSRALGLLGRKQNDWKAVVEVTARLREFDPEDPVRYDYSLFGAGIDGFLK